MAWRNLKRNFKLIFTDFKVKQTYNCGVVIFELLRKCELTEIRLKHVTMEDCRNIFLFLVLIAGPLSFAIFFSAIKCFFSAMAALYPEILMRCSSYFSWYSSISRSFASRIALYRSDVMTNGSNARISCKECSELFVIVRSEALGIIRPSVTLSTSADTSICCWMSFACWRWSLNAVQVTRWLRLR